MSLAGLFANALPHLARSGPRLAAIVRSRCELRPGTGGYAMSVNAPVPWGNLNIRLPLIFRKIPLKFRFQEGAAMTTRKPRNFDCPNGGLCVDGRCTRDHCVRGEKSLAVAEAATQHVRRPDPDYENAADQIVRAFSFRWD